LPFWYDFNGSDLLINSPAVIILEEYQQSWMTSCEHWLIVSLMCIDHIISFTAFQEIRSKLRAKRVIAALYELRKEGRPCIECLEKAREIQKVLYWSSHKELAGNFSV